MLDFYRMTTEKTKVTKAAAKPAKKTMHPVFASSSNAGELGTTWQGAIMGIAPIIIAYLQSRNVEITMNDVAELVKNATAVMAAVTLAYGVAQKFVIKAIAIAKQVYAALQK